MAGPTRLLTTDGGGGGTDERVRITISDTTAGFLSAKLSAHPNTPITLNVLNPGANEVLELDLDGDQVRIDWVPSNYTRNATPAEAAVVTDLTAHLKGIDDALLASNQPFLPFTLDVAVPASGTQYLDYGTISTASVPVVVPEAYNLVGASIKVDTADATRSYSLEILVNGTVRETLALAATNIENSTMSFTYSMSADDDIEVRLNRTAGSGKSSFKEVTVVLVVEG